MIEQSQQQLNPNTTTATVIILQPQESYAYDLHSRTVCFLSTWGQM